MSTKSITGTGLLLAVALLAQSLRLMFPFIPNQVSMFLMLFVASWPQLVTSSLGIILALLITKRTKN